MKRTALAMALVVALCGTGCMSADRSQLFAVTSNCKVTVYNGGRAVKVYHSAGKVLTEGSSDGWYFTDRDSGKLVRVSGTVVIEQE